MLKCHSELFKSSVKLADGLRLSTKEELKDVVYVYIADESSTEGKWKITIPDIHGIHYRITNEQSSALGKLYEYPGIPTYFVIDREGKLSYKVTGFPGAEVMKEELLKAGK